MLGLLLLMAEAAADPPADPLGELRGVVVAAIRNCGTKDGEIVVCSRDRGFSERERRLRKLEKPKPVNSGNGIKLEVSAGPRSADPYEE